MDANQTEENLSGIVVLALSDNVVVEKVSTIARFAMINPVII